MNIKFISSNLINKISTKSGFIILLFCCGLAIFVLPLLYTLPTQYGIFVFSDKGQIGDTVGGISSPFISVIGILITYLAFYIQVKANQSQRSEIRVQRKDIKIERFENKFYEMLRLQITNVSEMAIEKTERREAFKSMFTELKYCFFVVKKAHDKLSGDKIISKCTDKQMIRLAYIFFYSGVGHNSDKISRYLCGEEFDQNLYRKVHGELVEIAHTYNYNRVPNLRIEGLGTAYLDTQYKPFGGHNGELGHYYRHLYQIVKYVAEQNTRFIDEKKKLDYLRILRSQLSDYEQILLYYNAISGFGESWLKNSYLTTYRMIHNIPLPLADFGIKPEMQFQQELLSPENSDLFEWLENRQR